MSNDADCCGNCRFHIKEHTDTLCRRGPPQVIVMPRQNSIGQVIPAPMSMFPPVNPRGWCGEHKPEKLVLQ